jgi:hypothetical protein
MFLVLQFYLSLPVTQLRADNGVRQKGQAYRDSNTCATGAHQRARLALNGLQFGGKSANIRVDL